MRGYEGLRLFPTDIEVLRLHYAWTIDAWYARTVAARAEIVAMYDERFFRMWVFYLAGAAAAFRNGSLCNYQLQFSRSRTALPVTRDYMLAGEQGVAGVRQAFRHAGPVPASRAARDSGVALDPGTRPG